MNTTEKTMYFESTLSRQAEIRTKETADFTKNIEEAGLLCALEWADSTARQLVRAELWANVERLYREVGKTPAEAVELILSDVTKQLLNNWVQNSSTSQFANATGAAKAEGFARFHSEATAMVGFLTEE